MCKFQQLMKKVFILFLILNCIHFKVHSQTNDENLLYINLTDEKIYIDNKEIKLDSLSNKLAKLKKENPNIIFRLKVDNKTKMETVSKVKNLIYKKKN